MSARIVENFLYQFGDQNLFAQIVAKSTSGTNFSQNGKRHSYHLKMDQTIIQMIYLKFVLVAWTIVCFFIVNLGYGCALAVETVGTKMRLQNARDVEFIQITQQNHFVQLVGMTDLE